MAKVALPGLGIAALLLLLSAPAFAQEDEVVSKGAKIDKKVVDAAVKKACDWLKTQQKADGSFQGAGLYDGFYPYASTAFVLFALLKGTENGDSKCIQDGFNYLKAQKARTLIKGDFDAAFEQVDVIVAPTSPTTAFRIGEKTDDPLQMYLSDIFTLSMNLAGICGLSLPCGFDSVGLPIGLQVMGPALGEKQALRVAYAYEQATDWHKRRPPLRR